MVEVEEGLEGWGSQVQIRAYVFYADNGLIASTHTECLQGDFDTLTGLFDRVGLRKNVVKIVGMICHPCRAVGTQS